MRNEEFRTRSHSVCSCCSVTGASRPYTRNSGSVDRSRTTVPTPPFRTCRLRINRAFPGSTTYWRPLSRGGPPRPGANARCRHKISRSWKPNKRQTKIKPARTPAPTEEGLGAGNPEIHRWKITTLTMATRLRRWTEKKVDTKVSKGKANTENEKVRYQLPIC